MTRLAKSVSVQHSNTIYPGSAASPTLHQMSVSCPRSLFNFSFASFPLFLYRLHCFDGVIMIIFICAAHAIYSYALKKVSYKFLWLFGCTDTTRRFTAPSPSSVNNSVCFCYLNKLMLKFLMFPRFSESMHSS